MTCDERGSSSARFSSIFVFSSFATKQSPHVRPSSPFFASSQFQQACREFKERLPQFLWLRHRQKPAQLKFRTSGEISPLQSSAASAMVALLCTTLGRPWGLSLNSHCANHGEVVKETCPIIYCYTSVAQCRHSSLRKQIPGLETLFTVRREHDDRKRGRGSLQVSCAGEDEGETQSSKLGSIIKTKQRILMSQLQSMSEGELESKLSGLQAAPKPYNLLDTIAQQIVEGRTTIVVEVARLSPAETPESLAERCVKYVEWGATALAIRTDEEATPNGLADLTAVCQAVNVPVVRRDWIIHPLQIAETCEAGAAALTAVYAVLSKGLPAILNYTVSLGLDAVVEVINMKELQEVATLGIPIFGINLSVGLALSMPGIRQDISKSLIGEIPFGASSMVGVYSIDEARTMKAVGADAVYVRCEVLQGPQSLEKNSESFLVDLANAMSGDD